MPPISVFVNGAGISGLLFALTLRRLCGAEITVVDSRRTAKSVLPERNHGVFLSPAALRAISFADPSVGHMLLQKGHKGFPLKFGRTIRVAHEKKDKGKRAMAWSFAKCAYHPDESFFSARGEQSQMKEEEEEEEREKRGGNPEEGRMIPNSENTSKGKNKRKKKGKKREDASEGKPPQDDDVAKNHRRNVANTDLAAPSCFAVGIEYSDLLSLLLSAWGPANVKWATSVKDRTPEAVLLSSRTGMSSKLRCDLYVGADGARGNSRRFVLAQNEMPTARSVTFAALAATVSLQTISPAKAPRAAAAAKTRGPSAVASPQSGPTAAAATQQKKRAAAVAARGGDPNDLADDDDDDADVADEDDDEEEEDADDEVHSLSSLSSVFSSGLLVDYWRSPLRARLFPVSATKVCVIANCPPMLFQQASPTEELRNLYADFPEPLKSVLMDSRTLSVSRMKAPPHVACDRLVSPEGSGRSVLIGDAAHSISLGRLEGVAQAATDGVLLAAAVAQAVKKTEATSPSSSSLLTDERARSPEQTSCNVRTKEPSPRAAHAL